MDHNLKDCLRGEHGSYILPFLWLHGEPQERLREEILAIKNSGIREFCAESRPYEKFCQDVWWDDFGFILKTARELGMRVRLLDDRNLAHRRRDKFSSYIQIPPSGILGEIAVCQYRA